MILVLQDMTVIRIQTCESIKPYNHTSDKTWWAIGCILPSFFAGTRGKNGTFRLTCGFIDSLAIKNLKGNQMHMHRVRDPRLIVPCPYFCRTKYWKFSDIIPHQSIDRPHRMTMFSTGWGSHRHQFKV